MDACRNWIQRIWAILEHKETISLGVGAVLVKVSCYTYKEQKFEEKNAIHSIPN